MINILLVLLLGSSASAAPTDIFPRATICGGNAGLAQCGGGFPADFCCPLSSICLPLNATGAIATVCCPPGVDCSTIQPTTCETNAYNATSAAANGVHASPILPLATCGKACCPAGYQCQGGSVCTAIVAAANSTTTAVSTQSIASTATATATAVPANDTPSPGPASSSSFSGSSFAAGFVPGIIIGMLVLAGIFWLLKRRREAAYNSDKARSQDQLTTLSPTAGPPRLQLHMRSISEPAVLANGGHRTDFLRSSPPHDSSHDSDHAGSFDTIEEETSSSDHYEPRPMFQFSPSPVQPRSPLPAHMKRGTLSYAISPIRQLRTKKSLQSLRRHAASPMRSASQRQRASLARSNTSLSTETIQVLMTPDQRPDYLEPGAAYDRSRTPVASSIYPDRSAWNTPSRQPTHPLPGVLGSPYSYQAREDSQHLAVGDAKNKRVTTFSSLMERAGLRKEDLLPGPLR